MWPAGETPDTGDGHRQERKVTRAAGARVRPFDDCHVETETGDNGRCRKKTAENVRGGTRARPQVPGVKGTGRPRQEGGEWPAQEETKDDRHVGRTRRLGSSMRLP